MYKVVVEVEGYFDTHTDRLDYEEARELLSNLKSYFPDRLYGLRSYEYEYEEKEERTYNENACDGWEDIYPLDED